MKIWKANKNKMQSTSEDWLSEGGERKCREILLWLRFRTSLHISGLQCN